MGRFSAARASHGVLLLRYFSKLHGKSPKILLGSSITIATTPSSLGYVGDSIINSVMDVIWMALGFLVAWRAPIDRHVSCSRWRWKRLLPM
jgi:hypothetical protein